MSIHDRWPLLPKCICMLLLRCLIASPNNVTCMGLFRIKTYALLCMKRVQDWYQLPEIVWMMFQFWGLPGVDLFMSVQSTQLPQCFSIQTAHDGAWGLDISISAGHPSSGIHSLCHSSSLSHLLNWCNSREPSLW